MGDPVRPDWSGRLRRLWNLAPDRLSALVITSPHNINYLCGFDGSAGLLVTSPQRTWLLLDGRYISAAQTARDAGRLAEVEIQAVTGGFDAALAALLSPRHSEPIGFEAAHLTVAGLESWQKRNPSLTFEPTKRLVERLRLIKDDWEVAAIRRACSRLSGVARELGNWVAEGRTERQIAHSIDDAMRRAGMERPAFATIVASGPNSALPHARPTDRRLENGDLVVLDFGGVLDGYCGDLTRMAGVGQVKAEAWTLYEAVRAAQGAALAAVRAEALAFEVDAAARRVLTTHGFGEAFLHATGHGLGLEVHEAPRLGRLPEKLDEGRDQSEEFERLAPGMVCTIEPGAYVDGIGGVRLEDDIVVTAGGCEVLTDVPRELLLV